MKIKTNHINTKKRTALIIASSLLVIIVAGISFLFITQAFNNDSTDETLPQSINIEKPSEEEVTAGQTEKDEAIKQNDEQSNETPDENDVKINTSFVDNGDDYKITTIIETLTAAGTCELTMSGPNNEKIFRSADVQPVTTYTTCKGFNIKKTDLSPGLWNISVTFSNDSLNLTSSTEGRVQ